jgi:hypothetical protein
MLTFCKIVFVKSQLHERIYVALELTKRRVRNEEAPEPEELGCDTVLRGRGYLTPQEEVIRQFGTMWNGGK